MATVKAGIIGSGTVVAALLLLTGTAPPVGAAPARPTEAVRTCPAPVLTPDPEWSTTPWTPPGNPSSSIERIPAPARSQTVLDMDADGTADTVSVATDGTLTVERGDGDLVVTGIPADGTQRSITGDDLDGDGRSELVVWRLTGSNGGAAATTYLLAGTTPTGTIAISSAGATFAGTVTGDVTGDGLDDLDVSVPYLTTRVPLGFYAGADVIAALPSSSPFAGADLIALRADLDFDGEVDTLHRRPDGAQDLVLSTGGTLSLATSTSTLATSAFRTRSRTIIQTVALTTGVLTTGYELHNTCADAWMRSVTKMVVNRSPVPSDYPTFGPTAEPTEAQRRIRTDQLVRTVSARTFLAKNWFTFYLGRAADPVGLDYWVRALRAGRQTPDSMAATLISSREFLLKRSGVTPRDWVEAVYPLVFDRAPDPGGLAYWTQQASKLGPQRTAARLIASPEHRRLAIRTISGCVCVLGGPPPTRIVKSGLAAWTAGGYDRMLAELLATDDVYLHAQRTNRMKPA